MTDTERRDLEDYLADLCNIFDQLVDDGQELADTDPLFIEINELYTLLEAS